MYRSFRRPGRSAFAVLTAAILFTILPIAARAIAPPQNIPIGPGLFQDVPSMASVDVAEGVGVVRGRTVTLASVDVAEGVGVVRGRTVTLRPDVLNALRPGESRLDLNLFSDVRFTGIVDRVEGHRIGGVSYGGRLAEDPNGYFALVVKGDAVAGLVRTDSGGLFEIGTLQPGVHAVRQIDPDALPACGNTSAQAVPAGSLPKADPPAAETPATETPAAVGEEAAGDSAYQVGPVIDVLVVYTAEAMTAAGGKDSIEAKAQLAIDQGKLAYANSQIGATLNLVHVAQVSYGESTGASGFSAALNALTTNGDEQMDEVHSIRAQYGADVVSLLVKNGSYCGLGWVMTSLSSGFAAYGFNVVAQNCTSGTTMAHEIGHNEGSHHDRDNAKDTSGNLSKGLYSYSYGWRFTGDNGTLYRTVMSYAPGTQIPYFSNPDIIYQGKPTGVPLGQANESNNALSIRNARNVVAAWRASTSAPEPVLAETRLTAESFVPGNGAPDPGEVITMDVLLGNASSRSTTNLIATLETSGGILPITAVQNYGAIAGGGNPVARSFQLQANGVCGGTATMSLNLAEDGQKLGTLTIPLKLGGLGDPATVPFDSGALSVPIPDQAMVEHTLSVPPLGIVEKAVVRLRLNHVYDSDLNISLIAPDGTTVDLSSANGGSGDNYGTGSLVDGTVVYTAFDDAARTSVTSGTAPFAGSYRPEQSLTNVQGLDAAGVWTLRVVDRLSTDTGTLCGWGMDLTTRPPICINTASLNMADAAAALQVSSGLAAALKDQWPRLDLVLNPPAPGEIDLNDAVGIVRKVAGLE